MSMALTGLLIFCLIAWGFVLVPPAVRLLSGVIRPSDSIGTFRNKMAVLAGTSPVGFAPAGVPTATSEANEANRQVLDLSAHRRAHNARSDSARRRAARQRRRQVFITLLSSVPVTFLLGVAVGGPAWMIFLLSLAAFAGYTALLWQMQQATLERTRKVAVFPVAAQPGRDASDLRRVSFVGR
jgi:hypothetical protein